MGFAVLAAGYGVVQVRSQAILDTRHVAPPSAVRAATDPAAVAQGARLVLVADCAGCHAADLTGRMVTVSGSPVAAPNLTLLAKLSDADIDRAIRQGLRPDGRSELAMPSQVYAGFTDDEVAAIIGYLRSLPPRGAQAPQPAPGVMLRAYLVTGSLKTEPEKLARVSLPIDAGPGFAEGRHLAAVDCGQCHGTNLGGGPGLPGPDMTVRGYYDRAQFHSLMRTGVSAGVGEMALMSQTARDSFSHFTDAEIDAIYDYLDARDRLLSTDPAHRANR